MHSTDVGAEPGRICVFRYGNKDLDVVGSAAAFELCFGLSRENRLEWLRFGTDQGEKPTLSIYSIRDPECDSTKHSTQISGFTCVFNR